MTALPLRPNSAVRARPRAGTCPACGSGTLRVTSRERVPMMGELGPSELTLRCDNEACGHSETRFCGHGPDAGDG